MALLNFMKQFAGHVDSGKKRQTIRKLRKHPIKVGERLHLYTGLRLKTTRKLRENEIDVCTFASPIKIEHFTGVGDTEFERLAHRYIVTVGDKRLSKEEIEELARLDGFPSAFQFINFFTQTHELPFDGQVIRW